MDKWELLTQLTAARESYELSDRTLRVLAVLLGVHRERELTDGAPLIVYASNATLCERAHGMPESTLRRHLAALVASGLIARHDSPNGKRYQRRDASGAVVRAYGFDLRPLLLRAGEIAHHARAAEIRSNEIALLREEVVLLIRDASDLAQLGHASELDEGLDAIEDAVILAKRQLRRKLGLEDLSTIRDRLQPLVATLVEKLTPEVEPTDPVTPELIASDSQNERHIQVSDKTLIDLKERVPEPHKAQSVQKALSPILTACPDVLPYAEKRVSDWTSFVQLMARIAPMTGIDPSTWQEACRAMGPEDAATTLAGIVQNVGTIRSPGAYLRSLSRKAQEGSFTPDAMISSLQRKAA
ncbi:Replication protein C [Salipiger bermudensis HTCC2601]|uniref:Replication protein C n=2 Tax=Salipiger TaxID=263377 RepID=Q0FMK9_SALBH|nr:Replication protein C [Salipiger bermudensis HTCC2601]